MSLFTIDDPERVFFTADQHFAHANIIKFTDRPYKTVEEMDAALIKNWNKVIGPDDLVFHLGDFTLGTLDTARSYFAPLNGRIKFLCNPWHHDKRWLPEAQHTIISSAFHAVEWLPPMVVLEVPPWGRDGHPLAITLCHYPLAVWDRKHYGAWHLHAHSHGQYKSPDDGFMLDVGVDNTNFYPIKLGGVLEWMYALGW